ncbi:DUF3108 domain-containing protein [Sphingomonas radiodurans]|uniref:DUF3108 domain-containing protein n=1 Tax=Sphingomonas radiodurans TaxID=2890321 RepID=UPI001E4797AC|nr:DUF3108 domain-containing protein [Sphingomonas radiodurans]WBH17997.1 DUF3108 domain-containing protein [Sphingomonas radiodurans]
MPLPRRDGVITYRHADGERWGSERWSMTRGADGLRVLTAHCEMALRADVVVRDSVLSVDAAFQPCEAYVRIMNQGRLTGSGWFRFDREYAEYEGFTAAEGRLSQRIAIQRPLRGFGVHAVQSDGWLGAAFPFDQGAGHVKFWGQNLMHSLHHLGASGPFLATTKSGLEYVGLETVTVPAGTFECRRIRLRGTTNDHPPYDMWLSTDGDHLYVKGVVGGYMASVFELDELTGAPIEQQ